ncbi:RecQ family ATP-dependent DNA helicase [Chitinibacter bivalviorum]|uniref:DNA 3'-5' helicase n=2 Tax=Chitinibacter bivalviorum TaxID=2739434 RepID=A0A7H9BPG5_9NEIS|nr:RecQ family ATP-dependent DNA helicase [Chitinibacter bivalviorum]
MSVPNPKALIFDLEVIPGINNAPDKIIKIGALRPDINESLELKVSAKNLAAALQELDRLSVGASFVMGHNILEHDLPILRAIAPELALLNLPVIDTLRLSPLAFPQNPYHRLIKNYKLIRDSINSPLADCHATLTLFNDQRQAFEKLNEISKEELRVYHALIAAQPGPGLGNYMLSQTHQKAPDLDELRAMIPELLRENDPTLARDLKVCRQRLSRLVNDDLSNPAMYWPIAYSIAWLRVSGGNSVLAPWVRYQFPEVTALLIDLRDKPCGDPKCQYCSTTHNPEHELKRYFGYDSFRPVPKNQTGESLQRDIVLAGMRGEHVLAILPTGGGKSLCYQIPALNRFHRNGGLTVIISPLQSLMKDQVDGMVANNIQSAATLNGMLTMPERADTLEKIQMGDVGILLVSPEQFRNKAFRSAIEHRQINAWIFDEAHCLSKWGNDFRPDYLYASRFIRDFSGTHPISPIGCFTATAKLEVLDDINEHFKRELNVELTPFKGGHERTNLDFEVMPSSKGEKWHRTHQLLKAELEHTKGGAVVFVASRKSAEELAEFLKKQSWACQHFHAGIPPQLKKDIQDEFIQGELRVIVATNAFGMGVDKSDIRIVIHAEIPGSLENYLQEAGRAGRDQEHARCVLLYDPSDIETQFRLSERSRLTKNDIEQILKKLRNAAKRRHDGQLIITAGEILNDQYVHTSFEADDRDAETKVATAVAWLERAHFLQRNENNTQVFPAKLKHQTVEEAIATLKSAELPERRKQEYTSILSILYDAKADDRVSTDQLMLHTGLTQDEVTAILRQLENMGLLINDTQITLYLRVGIAGASDSRLKNSISLEVALFAELREWATDADQGEWQDINLPALTTKLSAVLQRQVLPLQVSQLLQTLSQDTDEEGRHRGSFDIRQHSRDQLKICIKGKNRTWSDIEEMAEKRRVIAQKILEFLLGKLPAGTKGSDKLVETTLGELVDVITLDLELSTLTRPEKRIAAIQHVLLYLHHEDVLVLNHGMTVMRRAMTIKINDEQLRRYQKDDYQPLEEHYSEKRVQVHVMREYAEVAIKEMADAIKLVMDYFTLPKRDFIKRYFGHKKEILELATSESSFRKIVDPLSRSQHPIVTDENDTNRLVLAGPGSGKTRVIVHRVAFLLRVKRIPASSIIVLTFNRHAANEIRKRLYALVGSDAFGLTVLTYHAMAMRLMGISFGGRNDVAETEIEQVLHNAVLLLEGKLNAEGEDELRDKLLEGYRYIMVDEYQDIDDWQYRLVSALAGRLSSEDGKLTILAVGDDDQNVYSWRETSNLYIEQFCNDYQAEQRFLVENYRSTRNIIDAANSVIVANEGRLKSEHPIRIDDNRAADLLGGRWQEIDGERRGQVLRLRISGHDREHGNIQCQAAISELRRLIQLEEGSNWSDCAILARTNHYLLPFQAWSEQNHIPYIMAADKERQIPITRQQDFVRALDAVRQLQQKEITITDAFRIMLERCTEPDWIDYFTKASEQLTAEFGDCQLSIEMLVDWLYDYARETKRSNSGLYLGTVHSAKGLEFKHVVVLDGGWNKETEDERRLYYVGMTRAQQTLTLCEFADKKHLFSKLLDRTTCMMREAREYKIDPQLNMRYHSLSLREIDLGYAGRKPSTHDIHQQIAALKYGDRLAVRQLVDGRYEFLDQFEQVVGRTAQKFSLQQECDFAEVNAIVVMDKLAQKEEYQASCKMDQWAVVVPRIVGSSNKLEIPTPNNAFAAEY